MLANTAQRCVTIEARGAWVHGGGFAGYREARRARIERLDELHRRWDEERQHLMLVVRTLQEQASRSPAMASRYGAAQTRLRKYEEAGPPQARPRPQNVRFRLIGGRTGDKVLSCARLEIPGLAKAFDLEVRFGERIAAVGPNGSGKSHFLRLLSGEPIAHGGVWHTGARVVAGLFAQKHDRPDLFGQTIIDLLLDGRVDRGRAMGALRRYELDERAEQRFETLSGGEQARFQILLLELSGATLLLLDEPTDNLDVASAEALEAGLSAYTGTVIAATHDRWFARSFDRFLVFDGDGGVRVSPDAGWEAE
jgi:ATPase subunit of ABC transporter with duplicated ATPase domains